MTLRVMLFFESTKACIKISYQYLNIEELSLLVLFVITLIAILQSMSPVFIFMTSLLFWVQNITLVIETIND